MSNGEAKWHRWKEIITAIVPVVVPLLVLVVTVAGNYVWSTVKEWEAREQYENKRFEELAIETAYLRGLLEGQCCGADCVETPAEDGEDSEDSGQ